MKQTLNIFALMLLIFSTYFYLTGLYEFIFNDGHFFNQYYFWSFLLSIFSTVILFKTKFISNFLATKKFTLK